MHGSLLGLAVAVMMLVCFQGSGLCVAWRVFPRESLGIRLLVGSVLGSAAFHWFPALAAFVFGFTFWAHLAALLAAMACGGAALAYGSKRQAPAAPLPALGRSVLGQKLIFLVPLLWLFYCLLVWRSFVWEDGRIYSSQGTFGDMPMHLSFITSLANQRAFPPDYSILPGTRLSYPVLSDSVSASLYLLGAPLRWAYCLPMWLAGGQVFLGAWVFLGTLMDRRRRGAAAWILFFFNGGLGLIYFLGGPPEQFTRIFTGYYQTPTNLFDENIRWVNVVVDMLLPQRATLFGWAMLFTCLFLLYRAAFQHQPGYFVPAGVLAGALPMVHTHSFLALGLVCGAWLTGALVRRAKLEKPVVLGAKLLIVLGLGIMSLLAARLTPNQKNSPLMLLAACGGLALWAGAVGLLALRAFRRGDGRWLLLTWGRFLLTVCLLAAPQLFTWTFRQVGGGSMVRGHFGWLVGDDPYLWFYLKNLGLAAVLGLAGLLCANKKAFAKYCPALAIWFLAEFVEFQPNDYDNNKLLYVGFLFLCAASAEVLCEGFAKVRFLCREPAYYTAAVGVVLAVLSLPAGLTMAREYVSRYELFGVGALELCRFLEENTPADAVILTDQRHNNEVASLAGRNIVCGSPAYLYYHGLNYGEAEQALRKMYEKPEKNRELFWEYGVDYVLVSDFEADSYEVDAEGLARLFPCVFDDGARQLFRVTSPQRAGK